MRDVASEIRRRLADLRLAPMREAEIVEELSQHLQDRYNELRSAGATEEEAASVALGELDDSDRLDRRLAEVEHRVSQESPMLGSRSRPRAAGLLHDVRHAIRTFRKNPGFTERGKDSCTETGYDRSWDASHERRIGTTCFACMACR